LKGGNCDALQLEGCVTSRQSFCGIWTLITRPIMHQHTNPTFSQPPLDLVTRFPI